MRIATAQERHRAHDTSKWRLVGALGLLLQILSSCSSALPRPPFTQVSAEDYVPVSSPPRIAPLEFIPPQPAKDAVWIDGSWQWTGNRYGWRYGSWVVPPPGLRRARWAIVRRKADGQLFFAPASWKDATGKTVDDRSFAGALGPAARARSRLGAPPPSLGREMPEGGQRQRQRQGEREREGESRPPDQYFDEDEE